MDESDRDSWSFVDEDETRDRTSLPLSSDLSGADTTGKLCSDSSSWHSSDCCTGPGIQLVLVTCALSMVIATFRYCRSLLS